MIIIALAARVGAAGTLLAVVAACSTPAKTATVATDGRSPLRQLADSTERLVTNAARSSDSAMVAAGQAVADTALEGMRSRVLAARAAVERAAVRMGQAVAQGDRIRLSYIADTRGSRRADEYERYWLLGREKLALARAYSLDAVASADTALGCPQTACTSSRTRLFHTQALSASGATREAESLVRVAMRYVY